MDCSGSETPDVRGFLSCRKTASCSRRDSSRSSRWPAETACSNKACWISCGRLSHIRITAAPSARANRWSGSASMEPSIPAIRLLNKRAGQAFCSTHCGLCHIRRSVTLRCSTECAKYSVPRSLSSCLLVCASPGASSRFAAAAIEDDNFDMEGRSSLSWSDNRQTSWALACAPMMLALLICRGCPRRPIAIEASLPRWPPWLP